MKKVQNILIVGYGDIGRRVARKLRGSRRYRISALVRKSPDGYMVPKIAGSLRVQLVRGDLGNRHSLQNLKTRADTVFHFAPPTATGTSDEHTKNLLRALTGAHPFHPDPRRAKRGMLPRQIVYISTTGVYGDCEGAWIDETRALKPESARAKRRVDAERRLQRWGWKYGVAITVLRAPGIYAGDRLPVDRLLRQTPVLAAEDDVFTNHIHADDLAAAAIVAMLQPRPKRFRVFNVVDDSQLLMGDYFDQVADALGLERAARIPRSEAEQQIAPMMLSFMRESRRIRNARLKRELKFVFEHPTLAHGLSRVQPLAKTRAD
jgi:nucleoside-diphosphate-sugar epimerase